MNDKRPGAKPKKNAKEAQTNCDTCVNYIYDDEYCYYTCMINLDEDEMVKFLSGSFSACPYYRLNDDYKIVRKQN